MTQPKNQSLRHLVAPLFLSALAALSVSCGEDGAVANACGDGYNAQTGAVGDFGAGQAEQSLEAFLAASVDLSKASIAVESDFLDACGSMADDLGLSAADLAPTGTETAMLSTCSRLAEEIDSILTDSQAQVVITVTPAVCEVSLSFAAECAAECDVSITGEAMVSCEGELSGSCEGSCMGSCTVEASGQCTGSCAAECTGNCNGVCQGTCDGTCSAMDGEGNCAGTCQGTCEGSCSATCTGTCSGGCTAEVTGECMGTCRGSCEGTFEAKCDGNANIEASADCKAACETRADASAECSDPEIEVAILATAPTEDQQAKLDALLATLEENYPKFLGASARLATTLVPATANYVARLGSLVQNVASVSAKAVACSGVALESALAAQVRINASVSVSVMVTGSVSGEAG